MAFASLKYDKFFYKRDLNQSVSSLDYLLDPIKYNNASKCRIQFGIVGGTDVSQVKGNLVDLENDLYGLSRSASKCPSKKFLPKCPEDDIEYFIRDCDGKTIIDTELVHLPECQMVDYKPIPLPPPMVISNCSYPGIRQVKPSCQSFMNSYSNIK
jgi:hypothetical protein